MKKIRAKIVGATGYGGIGLIELILRHPQVEIAALVAPSGTGEPISKTWPHLQGACDLPLYTPDDPGADADCDVVIFSTPDGVAQAQAAAEVHRGRHVLDFSGDFRAADLAGYAKYAARLGRGPDHRAPKLLANSVYGLPELYRDRIAGARLVANPGCFAVGCVLGLAPAVREGLIETSRIVCDVKSGVSGAGKKPKPQFHYPELYENTTVLFP